MGVWRFFVSVIIILLIVFPASDFLPIANANAQIWHPENIHLPTWHISGHEQSEHSIVPQIGANLAGSLQALPTDENDAAENDGFEKSVNLLRSLLWRMTRNLQQLPIKSWLADLEANISHKSEDIALEEIAVDVDIQI
ncbi:MAG: hypothetical protein SWY16_11695 [Cyanobacteriota bacterium]|nr:hypothetical protein [Cyanobacteriota bacterium]